MATIATVQQQSNPEEKKIRTCSFCGKFFMDLLQAEGRGWIRHVWKSCPHCKHSLELGEPKTCRWRHCYPTINFLLKLSPKEFKLAYPKDTEAQARQLIAWRNEGYTFLPICDNHDPETGECLGHEGSN